MTARRDRSHYCEVCQWYFVATHPDPERMWAICPKCGSKMFLLPAVDRYCKMGEGEVTYRKIGRNEY